MKRTSAGYMFPYLYDETQEVAKAFQAACTPDFFLFDNAGKLVYRGQFDDSRPGNGIPVTGHDLRAALDAVLAGKPVPARKSRASAATSSGSRATNPGISTCDLRRAMCDRRISSTSVVTVAHHKSPLAHSYAEGCGVPRCWSRNPSVRCHADSAAAALYLVGMFGSVGASFANACCAS